MLLSHFDKKFSNFSLIFVTSIFNFSFISFSLFLSCSYFILKLISKSLIVLSYNLFILSISFSILFFKFLPSLTFSLNSSNDFSIDKFSFSIESISVISIIL